jgi:hypothetical protein
MLDHLRHWKVFWKMDNSFKTIAKFCDLFYATGLPLTCGHQWHTRDWTNLQWLWGNCAIQKLRHWKVFWIQKQRHWNCFNIIIVRTETMSIYAIASMSFKFHHWCVTINHIFWFNFRLILYCIIIELVALGYSGAPISVIFVLLAFGWINWHSANCSLYLRSTRGC